MTFPNSKSNEILITIDGKQLSYPGTGLALVTSELLHGFQEIGYAAYISVFVENSFDPDIYELENTDFNWIKVDIKNYNVDYINRFVWGYAVKQELKKINSKYRHFIPYLYNYGDLRHNVVLVPDLVYRIFPDYGFKDPQRPWWNLRGRLPVRPIIRNLEEWLVTRAENLVVYSEFVKNHIHNELKISCNRISVIPLATPRWTKTKYASINNKKIKTTLNLPERYVLYVGGFAVRKNVPLLLRACGLIYQQDPSFRCVFVGLTNDVIRNNSNISEALNNSSVRNAIVTTPNLSYQDLASLYHLAEFTVYPSISEGFGLPILEAASSGKLCLCGDNSSMIEIQKHSHYRIKSGSQESWVSKILYYWQNPEKALEAGTACQKICEQYSWHKSVKEILNLLQN